MESYNNTSGKVAFDPGWNDPPKIDYSAQNTPPNKSRNILNKRVAFPISSTAHSHTTHTSNLPSTYLPSVPPTQSNRVDLTKENVVIDSESTLREVKDILFKLLDESEELGPKANDIRKRISIMEQMWSSGKLNSRIQVQMKEMALALKDDQPSKADDLHRSLMVDHVSAVGSWMPGVKQLIHHCIARSELLSLDKEDS